MFGRFLLVGGLGFCIDAGITYLLIQLTIAPWIARIPAILLAMTFTWLVNRYFTYQVDKPHSTHEALRYALVASAMAAINYLIYCVLIRYGIEPLVAVTLATVCQTVISFHAYRYFVFSEQPINITKPATPKAKSVKLKTGKQNFSATTRAVLIGLGVFFALSLLAALFLNLPELTTSRLILKLSTLYDGFFRQ